MKIFQKLSLLSAAIAVLSAVSCVNEPFSGEGQEADGPIASVEQQIVYVKSSASLISSVQTGIDKMVEEIENDALAASLETLYDEFTNRGDALEDHIGFLRNGASWLEATMATLEQQKALAYVNGALYAAVDKEELKVAFESHLKAPLAELAESADKWIGASYETYYSVAQTAGTLEYLLTLAGRQLGDDKGGLEGLLSDVEAGLRDGAEPSELKALISVVDGNASALEQLHATVQSVVAELEAEYAKAFEAALSGSGDYSAKTLKKANTKASTELQNATASLNTLVDSIESCDADIEALKARVDKLEADVKELLGMIQSVTFMSQYSEEYVIAYYKMDNNSKMPVQGKPYDGKSVRTPIETIELNYMIRPASAASAVNKDVVSVVGYYADQIQTKSIDPTRFVNFTVTDVSVTNADRGIVTVKVSHDLKDDFYYRETGAKCALFIATGQTDVTSKFVEIYPKDESTNVYVESIKIDQDAFEIDEGQTKNLTATVNPSSATNKTISWTSSDTEIATIDQYSGVLTAVKQGNVTITATTNDINEWGDKLTASVNVKVNPSIRIGGPIWVEVGKTAELSLDKPATMNIESQEWYTSDPDKMTVERVNGIVTVTGLLPTYNEYTYEYNTVTVNCTINGTTTVGYEMKVVVPQPNQIKFNNYGDDVKQITMRLGQSLDLGGVILPVEASKLFRLYYESTSATGLGWIDKDNGMINPYGSTLPVEVVTVTAKAFEIDKHHRYATDYIYTRSITIFVEPYYVSTMTLPATHDMLLDQTATLPVTFTSDVEGHQPTYRNLRWTSSDPTVVSVNETTGEMTALKEGSATVTATTTHANAVPSGQAQKSASCIVTVKKPTAPIAIGDYYYSDGTWSTERDNSKTVVGIVFSKVGATTTDSKLNTDHPHCYNGLVVSLEERTTAWQSSAQNVSSWVTTNLSYGDLRNYNKTNGYSNTYALRQYNLSNGGSKVLAVDGTAPSAGAPGLSSGWYLPSYKELSLLAESYATIKDKLASVGTALDATAPNFNIGSGGSADTYRYWASTESASSSSWGCCVQFSNCSMMDNQGKNKNYYRVRYILAF